MFLKYDMIQMWLYSVLSHYSGQIFYYARRIVNIASEDETETRIVD